DDGNDVGGDGCSADCRVESDCPCEDKDGDGYLVEVGVQPIEGKNVRVTCCGFNDCNDMNPIIHPFAPDVPGDGLDTNCDGNTSCGVLADSGERPWSLALLALPALGAIVLRRRMR
ncbi:MAG: putative metal-binding motif-containing protein, partial [Myxococcales bacterium]|nr:putative metal-binding motif-containing protein [Myxococcales bacterium]